MTQSAQSVQSVPGQTQDDTALALSGITRSFHEGERELAVLKGVDFAMASSEMVSLVAPSGTGKSTLLQIAGLLEAPDSGAVYVGGQNCAELGDRELTAIRRDQIGFVYQFHHLLPEFTAQENVMLPQMIAGLSKREARGRAQELLDYMRLGDRAGHRPSELSGGEQQRVAIARAVANAPRVLLLDEPTGNLDPDTAGYVFEALKALVRASGVAALFATHNMELARSMDRCVTLQGGLLHPYHP